MDSDDFEFHDFEFSSKSTRAARYINADDFDDYINNKSLKAYIKSIDTDHKFTTITAMEFPSSISITFRALRKKYGYGAHQIEDVLVYFGLKLLWNIFKETKLEEISKVIENAKKYTLIPELKTKYIYKVSGDGSRTIHIHKETAAFCTELSTKLDVTNSSICMLAILLSLSKSPTVLNNYESINETFLFQLNDNIFNSSEQFFNVLVGWLVGWYNPIYNLYCKKILEGGSDKQQLQEMYEILIFLKENGSAIDNLIDYKSIAVNHNGIKTSVVNDTKKDQIPEFETLEPVFEQSVKTPIADKPITQENVIENPSESKPVIVQEPHTIVKEVIIENPVETDIKKVIKHLVKLIFNRLHLPKNNFRRR